MCAAVANPNKRACSENFEDQNEPKKQLTSLDRLYSKLANPELYSKIVKKWKASDEILGRGTFGEVRMTAERQVTKLIKKEDTYV